MQLNRLSDKPLQTGYPKLDTFANSENPDEVPLHATFHQGLHN